MTNEFIKMSKKQILDYIRTCPLGWFQGHLIVTRGRTEQEMIEWLDKLMRII